MTVLIINSQSGDAEQDLGFWRRYLQAAGLSGFDEVDFQEGDWRNAVQKDRLVLAAGGDGTISAVAGACVEADAVLAVLPSGTANDFARSLGVEADAETACRIAADGPERCVDVGVVDGRVFINMIHVGLGAEASAHVDEAAKSDWGDLSYVRSLVEKLGDDSGFSATVHIDDERLEGAWLEIGAANGSFYGGGHRVPGAMPDDGVLNFFGVHPDHAANLAVEYAKVRLLGPEEGSSELLEHRRFRHCRIETESPQPVTADGEEVGHTPVEIEIHVGALRVRVPNED